LSLHVLDIAENGIAADATLIDIEVSEQRQKNRLEMTIRDNGRGIAPQVLEQVLDPGHTPRKKHRGGLGLSLFREASRRCAGDFHIHSEEGEGTKVYASFRLDHVDRPPLGDVVGSLMCLIVGHPGVDFVYCHDVDGESFQLDTREVKQELEDVPIDHPDVIRYLTLFIRDSLTGLRRKV
jgi:hypothetical protein